MSISVSTGLSTVDLENRLRALETVADCRVLRRRDTDGMERAVVYAVPGPGVRAERMEEWVAALRKDCSHGSYNFEECDLVAVSRVPLTAEGDVDDALLVRLVVVDEELARRWEAELKRLPGIKDAMVTVETEQEPLPPLHFSDLFSEAHRMEQRETSSAVATPPEAAQSSFAESSLERPPALSEGGEIEGADRLPQLLSETLQQAAERYPEHGLRTLTEGGEEFLSYPELLELAERGLAGLRAAGLQPGDRVLFQLPHHRDFLIAFWACVLGGFVPAPLAPIRAGMGGGTEKLHHAWTILDASLLLTSRELLPALRGVFRSLGWDAARAQSLEDRDGEDARGPWHRGAPEDLALTMLTSGSTGVPKAVMLSHRNLIRRSAGSVQRNRFSSDAVTLNWMPLDHVAGIVYFHLRDVFLGCQQIHAATDLVTQDPLIWPEWVDRYRVSITFAPNFAFGLVNDRAAEVAARAGGGWDLSSLRHLLNGAEAIVPRTARRFLQMLAPYGLAADAMWPVWGMSETSSGTLYSETFRLETSSDEDAFVEVGRPIPGLSMRIVDENDAPLREGESGRLQVRGDQVTSGYYNRPHLTAEAFTADGWFKTGDLGLIAGGRLTITGREKDVIVINSVNYACHEIEGLVEEVPGVETSYTAACAIREAGSNTDRLAIFFHPAAGCEAVSAELLREIRSGVARRLGLSPDYLLPVEREAIPKSNIGKIQRAQLAKSFGEGKFGDVVRRTEVLLGGAHTLPDWFFEPVWRKAKLRGRRAVGQVLVFADAQGLGERLAQELGADCVLVARGNEFRDEGGRFMIDAGNGEHYTRLLEALARRGFVANTVAYLWTYREGADGRGKGKVALPSGTLGLLRLAQVLRGSARLIVASSGLQSVGGNDGAPAFEEASLLGLVKTIPQENPRVTCCHVDLPPREVETHTGLVLAEMRGEGRDAEVAYRAGERWGRGLRKARFTAATAGRSQLKRGGVYLLSGGMGGIGLELARSLLKTHAANLILIGRTDASARTETLATLETVAASLGGRVLYAAVDVTDEAGLRGVTTRAEALFGRNLDGVFHLAGRYEECALAEETEAGFAATLESKLGALALHQMLEDRPGALFVSFSSVNGFLGGYGAGAYAAANTWLESFSESQRATSGVQAYSIAWSLWDEVGMSRGYAGKTAARARGFYAISPRQGMASLLAILERAPGNILVGLDGANLQVRRLSDDLALPARTLSALVSGDLSASASAARPEIRDRYGVRNSCGLRHAAADSLDGEGRIDRNRARIPAQAGQTAAAARVAPAYELERTIAGIWQEVLGLEQLSVTDSFFDLGGTSLTLGQANGRLQQELQRRISMTETLQYATVRALAAHLSGGSEAATLSKLTGSQARGQQRREKMRTRLS